MIPVDDRDFISNVANQTACDLLAKMKKAAEYFREDPECMGKCFMMHHMVCAHLLADYILVMSDISELTAPGICQTVVDDAMDLFYKIKDEHGKSN